MELRLDVSDGETGRDEGCGPEGYPDVRSETDVIYVNGPCNCPEPDGSMVCPFPSIAQALDAAPPGAVVAVADGVYKESIEISKPVTLKGSGPVSCVLASPGEVSGMTISDVQGVSVGGMAMEAAPGVGLLISGAAEVSVEDVVSSGHWSSGDSLGVGLYVVESSDVELKDLVLALNEEFGLVVSDSSVRLTGATVSANGSGAASAGISVTDGSLVTLGSDEAVFPGDQDSGGNIVEGNDGLGVLVAESVLVARSNLIMSNLHGGLALVDCADPEQVSLIEGNEFHSNFTFGVGVFGGRASLLQNQLDTVLEGGQTHSGPCLYAAGGETGPAVLEVEGNEISNCSGTGILLDGVADTTVVGNLLEDVGFGGIWCRCGSVLEELSGNTVVKPGLAGISIMSDSTAPVHDNHVLSTSTAQWYSFERSMTVDAGGDGLVIKDIHPPATVTLSGNAVEASARAGMVVDAAGPSQVTFEEGNKVSGNEEAGIALQHGAESIAGGTDLEAVVALSDNGPSGQENVVLGSEYVVIDPFPPCE